MLFLKTEKCAQLCAELAWVCRGVAVGVFLLVTSFACGQTSDIGPIAVPKKTAEASPSQPSAKSAQPADSQIAVRVPVLTLDVGVISKDGIFIPGLKREQFRILEDGVPQTITSFGQTQAPITAVMLVEFANSFYEFQIDSLRAAYVFTSTLKKEDWVALLSYDTKPHLLQDFTQDKTAIFGGLNALRISASAETNLFDALYDTMERLETIEGRKYIILLSSGRDTFSKRPLDQVLKKVQASKDIVVYSISTGQALRYYAESHGLLAALCPLTEFNCRATFDQADRQLQTFGRMTGGKAYSPIFSGQFRDIFSDIGQTIRNQYVISYHPTNRAQDGTFRKVAVELVDEAGLPLRMKNEKGRDVKYQVLAREGYKAKQEVN